MGVRSSAELINMKALLLSPNNHNPPSGSFQINVRVSFADVFFLIELVSVI